MTSIFGGFLEFKSQEELTNFINTFDIEGAMKILEVSIDYGMKNGIYSLEEAYCLYMCLTKLKSIK